MINDSITIEFASHADAGQIAKLSKLYIEHGLGWKYTPDKITQLIRHARKNVVVAREDGQLAGFGIMTYHESRANLDLLAVKLRYRYQGIGRQIVQWLEEVALTAGIFTVYVQVRQINIGAIKFYQKLGYRTLNEQAGYYHGIETGVIMSRDLRNQ